MPPILVLAALAAAGSTTSTTAEDALARALGDAPFSVTADRLSGTPKAGVFVAEGDVVVRRPSLIVRADRVTFDDHNKRAIAEGHVAVVEGDSVLFCSRVEMALPEMLGGVRDAELRIKAGIPPALAAELDASQLREYGKDELILEARAVERTGARSFDVDGGAFTACDCGEDEAPTWRIDAGSASVDLDSGAFLTWPVFYAKSVPVLALPAFYVPLGARRTGLLAPRVGHSLATGFRASLPFFLTMGPSWDATIEAGMMFDRGPTSGLELRWAPSATARGVARVGGILDYGVPDGEGGWTRGRDDPFARFSVSARHESRLAGAKLAADVNLVGDPAYVSDLADAFLARQAESTTSRITLSAAGGDVRAAGGLAIVQDLRATSYPGAPDLRGVEIFSAAIPGAGEVRQRFAELRLDALPYPLLTGDSPVLGEARLALDVFAAPSPSLARFARVDLRPAVTLPIPLFGLAVLEPSIAARLTAWGGREDREDQSATRTAVVARATLATELGRRYGAWVHRIRPALDYVLVPYVERRGSTAFATFDELDLLEPVQQVRARLATDVLAAANGRRAFGLEAWIGRDLGLPGGDDGAGTSELVVRGELQLAFLDGALALRFDGRSATVLEDGVLTELVAGVTLSAPARGALAVHYGRFDARLPRYAFIAAEELVPSRTIDTSPYVPLAEWIARVTAGERELLPWSAYQGVTVGAQLAQALPGDWGRLTLTFGATLVFDREQDRPPIAFGPAFLRDTSTLVRWDSSCDCLGLGAVVATARDRPGVDLVAVVVDLARLGQVTAQ